MTDFQDVLLNLLLLHCCNFQFHASLCVNIHMWMERECALLRCTGCQEHELRRSDHSSCDQQYKRQEDSQQEHDSGENGTVPTAASHDLTVLDISIDVVISMGCVEDAKGSDCDQYHPSAEGVCARICKLGDGESESHHVCTRPHSCMVRPFVGQMVAQEAVGIALGATAAVGVAVTAAGSALAAGAVRHRDAFVVTL